jgi:hypothetical protein
MSAVYRGVLTDILVENLEEQVGKPVGDGQAPLSGGWQGEPNQAGTNFVPYLVLTPGVGGNQSPGGPLSDTSADWNLAYNLSGFGVSRQQCEWIADRGRDSLSVLKGTVQQLGPSSNYEYTIQKISTAAIGSIQRVDATNPPYWGQVDQLTIWVTRGA